MDFQLHPQLAKDTYYLGDFPLSALLLSKDANYPWFILVPKRADITEPFQLGANDYAHLQQESLQLSQALHSAFKADKLNIAALGNMVPQLHVHHIVRYTKDTAWPNPVWGFSAAKTYTDQALKTCIETLSQHLQNSNFIATPLKDTHCE